MSFLLKIKFITEDWITKYTNITTKLNWKLFTKVIMRPREESLGLDRQRVLIKREVKLLLILWQTECLKSESSSALFEGKSRECFLEANIENQS
jgi:hypothetical protein